MNNANQIRIIRMKELLKTVGIGRTSIYKMIAAHEFPAQVKIGRASGWIAGEVTEWMNEQVRRNHEATCPKNTGSDQTKKVIEAADPSSRSEGAR